MNRRVLVTGGSGDIGGAIVTILARGGYAVTFTHNSSPSRAECLCTELRAAYNAEVTSIACDLNDLAATTSALRGAMEQDGPFYGFVHAAGFSDDCPAAMVDLARAERLLRVNFLSLAAIVKIVLRDMMARHEGRIVGIGSVAARVGQRGNGIYSASKAALEGFLRCLADEVSGHSVTVNWVCPGVIATTMTSGYRDLATHAAARVPAARLGRPVEVATAVAFLMSDDASFVHGTGLVVDGGLSATSGFALGGFGRKARSATVAGASCP